MRSPEQSKPRRQKVEENKGYRDGRAVGRLRVGKRVSVQDDGALETDGGDGYTMNVLHATGPYF